MWVRIGSKAAVTAVTALAVAGLAWAPAPLARAATGPASVGAQPGSPGRRPARLDNAAEPDSHATASCPLLIESGFH